MKALILELDKRHVWGRYHELRINSACIQRTVYLEEGGMNSLHRHDTIEWMTVVEGEVEFTVGASRDTLQQIKLGPGGSIEVPARFWHRIRYISGGFKLPNDDVSCAVINETMIGEHFDGQYVIERLEPALPSVRNNRERSGYG